METNEVASLREDLKEMLDRREEDRKALQALSTEIAVIRAQFKIAIALVLLVVVTAGGGVWFLGNINSRVAALAGPKGRLTVLETRASTLESRFPTDEQVKNSEGATERADAAAKRANDAAASVSVVASSAQRAAHDADAAAENATRANRTLAFWVGDTAKILGETQSVISRMLDEEQFASIKGDATGQGGVFTRWKSQTRLLLVQIEPLQKRPGESP